MPVHVALLRAVNLGAHNSVAMADLRALLEHLGLREGRSLLQSGNLIFRSDVRKTVALEALLEAAAAKRLGLRTDFFVRSAAEVSAVLERNPFPAEATRDPGHLVVMFLKAAAADEDVQALRASITGREVVRADGRQAYIVYPDGIGNSRLTHALVERKLRTRGTARNWNTVTKLGALAQT
jgi:uncharacterized protein (DUF1697 family)